MALKDLKVALQKDFPKTRPEKMVGEYAVSKNEDNTLK